MTEENTLTRTEKLLAMLLLETGTASQEQRCVQLNRAGLGNSEIAGLLGITPSSVGTNLHTARTRKTTKKAAKKGPAKKSSAKKSGKR